MKRKAKDGKMCFTLNGPIFFFFFFKCEINGLTDWSEWFRYRLLQSIKLLITRVLLVRVPVYLNELLAALDVIVFGSQV